MSLLIRSDAFLEAGPQRMVVLGPCSIVGVVVLPPVPIPRGSVVEVKTGRVAVVGGACPAQLVESRIRTPCVRVELQHDAFAFRGSDQGGVHIATLDEWSECLKFWIVRGSQSLGQRSFVGTHGHEVAQVVASQHVHVHAHGPETMGGVQVAIAFEVFSQPPAFVVVGGVQKQCPQIVQVSTFGVGHVAKHPLFDHVEQPQLFAVVATVLQHDAMPLGALRGRDQGEAIFFGVGDGHLACRVKPLLHGVQGHWGVEVPGGGNHHQVGHLRIARLTPSFTRCIVDEQGSGRLKGGDFVGSPGHVLCLNVAERHDFRMSLGHEPFQHFNEGTAAVAKAQHGHANFGNGGCGVVHHRPIDLGPRGIGLGACP